jgi:hypothetical protein
LRRKELAVIPDVDKSPSDQQSEICGGKPYYQQGSGSMPLSDKRESCCLLVQHDAQERGIDLNPAVVLDETEFPELVHEDLTRERVVPIIYASVSCDILGSTP